MITLKNKHKTKDVPRDLGKASHCPWKERALKFFGALTARAFASGYGLCCLLSRRDELGGMWQLARKFERRERRRRRVLVKNIGCSKSCRQPISSLETLQSSCP